MSTAAPELKTDAPFKEGDLVRLARPQNLYADMRKRIEGRQAVVARTYTRWGASEATVVVRFLKKNNRGKEFEEHFPLSSLLLDETTSA